ncbi:hypothetical protein [Promicromonospora sukumoe]
MGASYAGVGALDWTIDPPEGWSVVPAAATEAPDVIEAWEKEVTEWLSASFEQDAPDDADAADALRDQVLETVTTSIAHLRGLADEAAGEGERVVAAFGVADRTPVPVLLSVGMSDPAAPDEDLLDALGAKGGGAPIAPPSVDYLDLPEGDGVRVSRVDIDQYGGAWMSVGLGRRIEYPDAVVDTVLFWRSQDLFMTPIMIERLDELLPTITITRSES